MNRVGGIMGAPLECGRSWLRVGPGHTKDYAIDMCCFFRYKYAALSSKSKAWLARNQNNVSEWSDISIRELFVSVR
jgi:hypothetical protein